MEESTPLKHEYVAGEVFAMSGATLRHNLISQNIASRLRAAADGGPCRVFIEGVKLRVRRDAIYYPDVVVVCGPIRDSDVMVSNPGLVVEVLSPSTAGTDRREKLLAYRDIASLRSYLIVSQSRRRVERHWRDDAGDWWRSDIVGDGIVPVSCPELEVELTLDEIYHGVDVARVSERDAMAYVAPAWDED